LGKTPWARYSKKKPRKSYVKAMPHLSLLVYKMGKEDRNYDMTADLVLESDGGIQLRDNTLESARQAANKYLEKVLLNGFSFRVLVYPHNVIRENKMIAGAGADRLQKGMRQAYGRPTDRAARINTGQTIFTVKTMRANEPHIREAYRRACSKLSGRFGVKYSYKKAGG
jgi:large subunit ribosomal protein L10e